MVAQPETPQEMTELDAALEELRQNMDSAKCQSHFYDLFLNTTFFVPTLDESEMEDVAPTEKGQVLPLIVESEGNDYLLLFDTKVKMQAWADAGVKWVDVPGHVLAATSMPPLHWALNVGTDHVKQFFPDEITWLREAVERCNAVAESEDA